MNVDFSKYRLNSYAIDDPGFGKDYFSALRSLLVHLGVDASFYVLDSPDGGGEGQMCLHKEGAFWVVYSSERGERLNPSFFASPWDAANFLLWSLVSIGDFPRFCFDPLKWAKSDKNSENLGAKD